MIGDRTTEQLVGLGLDHLPERHRQRTRQLTPKREPVTAERRERHAVTGQRRVRIERTVLIQQLDPTPQLTPPCLERPILGPCDPVVLLIGDLVAHPRIAVSHHGPSVIEADGAGRQRVVDRAHFGPQLGTHLDPSRHRPPITPRHVRQPRRRHRPELAVTHLAGLELTQQMTLRRIQRGPSRRHVDCARQQLVVRREPDLGTGCLQTVLPKLGRIEHVIDSTGC